MAPISSVSDRTSRDGRETGLGIGVVEEAGAKERRDEHSPGEKDLHEGDGLEGQLAEPQRLELATVGQVVDELAEPPKVDGVLGQAAGAEHPHGDRERRLPADAGIDQLAVDLRER